MKPSILTLGHLADLIFDIADSAGVKLFLVGGAVRDRLLGLEISSDYDFVYEGDYGRFKADLFETIKFKEVVFTNKGFETSRLCFRKITMDFQSINGPSLITDAQKRDFTVNALYLHKSNGGYELMDFLSGEKDIKAGIIRQINEKSIFDDPLRVLRAFRFSSQLGFEIEPATLKRAGELGGMLKSVSSERIVYEMTSLFTDPLRETIGEMFDSGAADTLLGFRGSLPECPFREGAIGNLLDVFISSKKKELFSEFLTEYGFSKKSRDLAETILSSYEGSVRNRVGRLYKKDIKVLNEAAGYFYKRGLDEQSVLLKKIMTNHKAVLNGNEIARRFGASGKSLGTLLREAHVLQILEGEKDRERLTEYIVKYIEESGTEPA